LTHIPFTSPSTDRPSSQQQTCTVAKPSLNAALVVDPNIVAKPSLDATLVVDPKPSSLDAALVVTTNVEVGSASDMVLATLEGE
jgi:hypothetical protein